MPDNYSMTAEHRYISDVLYSLWSEYAQLDKEIKDFTPKPREASDVQYRTALARLSEMNLDSPLQPLEDIARGGADVAHKHQFSDTFNNRTMKLFVSVVFMSQALCEALINQILILRFHDEGILPLYSVWEKARFLDKWCLAPKSFMPGYALAKGNQIFEALQELVSQRNTYTHYKPMIEVDGKVIYGKDPKRQSFDDLMRWMHRFISLPYDLALLSSVLMKEPGYQILLDRRDIPEEAGHAREIERAFRAQQT